ncbi:hypothetical protein [Burkholderia sp. Ac-20344]|uniref:hypothetical protein n=1 Tax=Burkholderia sp. Ac-20344 TaxID=2703890 RepID=UPI00197BB5C9|nr:hypothetical protein [Burkholderia sp. Ac-20344]MBN3837320.1 hypothetical protein [Burkholderia sp. Ac-20344]
MKDSPRPGHDAPARKHQERTCTRHSERRIDPQLDDTFPASNPPATGGVTRMEPGMPPDTHDERPQQDPRERGGE